MSETWLDGNAMAGLLYEALGSEMTSSPHGCHGCGNTFAVAEHRLYTGAGLVLRCPGCGDVAATVVRLPDRYLLQLSGSWRLDVAIR